MNVISINEQTVLEQAVECLSAGGILIYPTETCYGVGVDATNPKAVTKVLKYKRRPQGKPISVGVASQKMAQEYVEIPPDALNIYQKFLPGPITIVSKSKHFVDSRLESEQGTLGIRIPDYPILLEIIKKFGKPITTTSANSSGKKTPYSVDDIFINISDKQKKLIHTIVNAGKLPKTPPSTVIDVSQSVLQVHRQGAITLFDNQQVIKKTTVASTEDMIKLGSSFIREANNKERNIIFLNGVLGAGKTQFVKGIAQGLGIERTVTSPTYTYMQEYKFDAKKLIHVDAWRIDSKEDLTTLAVNSIFSQNNLVAIEWPGIILNLDATILESKKIWIIDILVKDLNIREVIISKATI